MVELEVNIRLVVIIILREILLFWELSGSLQLKHFFCYFLIFMYLFSSPLFLTYLLHCLVAADFQKCYVPKPPIKLNH